jgi:hypothetical protein
VFISEWLMHWPRSQIMQYFYELRNVQPHRWTAFTISSNPIKEIKKEHVTKNRHKPGYLRQISTSRMTPDHIN